MSSRLKFRLGRRRLGHRSSERVCWLFNAFQRHFLGEASNPQCRSQQLSHMRQVPSTSLHPAHRPASPPPNCCIEALSRHPAPHELLSHSHMPSDDPVPCAPCPHTLQLASAEALTKCTVSAAWCASLVPGQPTQCHRRRFRRCKHKAEDSWSIIHCSLRLFESGATNKTARRRSTGHTHGNSIK